MTDDTLAGLGKFYFSFAYHAMHFEMDTIRQLQQNSM